MHKLCGGFGLRQFSGADSGFVIGFGCGMAKRSRIETANLGTAKGPHLSGSLIFVPEAIDVWLDEEIIGFEPEEG